MKKIIVPLLLVFSLTACVSSGNQELKNETQESVKTKLLKGKTTKEEVTSQFGEPYSRSTLDSGEEVWSYAMHNSQMSATSYIPIIGLFAGGRDNQSKTLQITFNGKVVDKWSFSSGSNNIKTGIN